MKQALFATPLDASPAGTGTAVIRASTPGTPAERLQALLPLARFAPLQGVAELPFKPVRLALLRGPDIGRCVLHSVIARPAPPGSFSGFDVQHATEPTEPPRMGLTHAVLDLPSMVDPQQALVSWGSDQWQQHDLPPLTELAEMLFIPVSGQLSEEGLARFLKDAEGRELAEFLLAAFLSTTSDTPIYLVASPERVAWALFTLTKALPLSLLEDLTFSTYESEPTGLKARVIGTSWPVGQDKDLPPTCYDGLGVGFNTATGTKTGVNTEMPFVRFSLDNLASTKPTALNDFHANWQRLGVKDLGLLDLVYRMTSGNGKLTKEESQRAIQDPALATWIATHPDALPQLLQWALEDTDYATITFSRAQLALRQKPEVLSRLGQIVHEEGLTALKAGQLARTRNALEIVLPMVAPAKAANLWMDLFKELQQPAQLSWEMREYLLPRLARLKPLPLNQVPDAQLAPWLQVPADQLGSFLAVDVPQSYHLAGLLHAEAQEGSVNQVAASLAKQPMLVIPLLAQVAAKPHGEARSLVLFEAVTAAAARPWAEDLLRGGRSLPLSLLDSCLDSVLRNQPPDPRSLARSHGSALLEQLAGQKSLDRLAEMLLRQPGAELLADEGVADFLEKLASHPGLAESTWKRLDAFLTLKNYLKHPSLHQESVRQVADALEVEPPLFGEETTQRLVAVAADQLLKSTGNVQQSLEDLVLNLGPRYPGGPTPFYRALLRQVEASKNFWKQEELLHAFVALSLDAAKADKVNEELNGLDPEAAHLVYGMKRAGGAKLIQSMDSRTQAWPRSARRQWVFLTQSAQLGAGGERSLFREAILVVAGAALAAAVFALLRYLKIL